MKILILTTGKTGSTALAYALKEQLADHKLYFEPANLDLTEEESKNCIVKFLKIHQWKQNKHFFDNFDQKILLVRHPFDQLISYSLYAPFDGNGFSNDVFALEYFNLLKAKRKNPKKVCFLDIIDCFCKITERNIDNFLNHFSSVYKSFIDCFESDYNFHLVKYEDFIDENLRELEHQLNVKINSQIQVATQFSRVKRSSKYGDWQTWFTKRDVDFFNPYYFNSLEKFSYSNNFESSGKKNISREQSLDYYLKLVNQYRNRNFLPDFKQSQILLSNEGLYFDRALSLYNNGSKLDALDVLEKAIQLNSKIAGFHILKGRILSEEKLLKKSIKSFNQAFLIDPDTRLRLQERPWFKKITQEAMS